MTNIKTLLPALAAAGVLTLAPMAFAVETAEAEETTPCIGGVDAECEAAKPPAPEEAAPETETETVFGGDREVEVEEEEEPEEPADTSGFGAPEETTEETPPT